VHVHGMSTLAHIGRGGDVGRIRRARSLTKLSVIKTEMVLNQKRNTLVCQLWKEMGQVTTKPTFFE
jgi:hypothetical protein